MDDGTRRSKTVRVAHRDQGGRSEAKAALEFFQTECRQTASLSPDAAVWTPSALMDDGISVAERGLAK